ncbi:MAG: SIMPL domain-containing protein [Hellea sp.]
MTFHFLQNISFGALLVVVTAVLGGCDVSKNPTEMDPKEIKTLSVVGVGEIEVMPDSFVVSGAVIKQDEDVTAAMNQVAEVINMVQDNLPKIEDIGLTEFNFATVNTTSVKDPECLLFNQEADRTNSSLREDEKRISKKLCKDVAQQASVTFTFTGGPPELAGTVISKLSEAGAVRVRLNGYRISNIEEVELQAGEKAVSNARDKAQRLADAGGANITGVLNLQSYRPTYSQQVANAPRVSTTGAGESARLLKDESESRSVTEMNLRPGPQVISAMVELEFIYE